jgi:hypothetical protein
MGARIRMAAAGTRGEIMTEDISYKTMLKRGRKPVVTDRLLSIKPGETVKWHNNSQRTIYHLARRNNLKGKFLTFIIDGKMYVSRKVEEA